MLATVDALLPLSLLEAVRDVDKPEELLEAEFVDELRNKRFGLSDTVYTQIKRYTEAVRRAAGRFLAREAYMTVSPVTRASLRFMPSLITRPVALRRMRRIAR